MTVDQKLKEIKKMRTLVGQMNKPDNFTYMDIAILDVLLKDLEEYISIEKTKRSVV